MEKFFEKIPNEKELLRKKAENDIENITDGLGKKIDSEIREVVIALKMKGFETKNSCEGHVEHGYPFPFVDVVAPTRNSARYNDLVEKYKNGKILTSDDEREGLFLKNNIEKEEEEISNRLNVMLDEFYKNSGGEKFITIKKYSSWYSIQPVGADNFKAVGFEEELTELEAERRRDFLNKTQKEMKRFVSFLDNKI